MGSERVSDHRHIALSFRLVRIWKFCTNFGLGIHFNYCGTIFCGQDNLLGGQLEAMGRFNLLDGQSN